MSIQVDQEICAQCGDCIPVCPSEAIFKEDALIPIASTQTPLETTDDILVSQQPPAKPIPAWPGVILSFLVEEITPRLLNILESRLSVSAHSSPTAPSPRNDGKMPSSQPTRQMSGMKAAGAQRLRRRVRGNRFESFTERR
jgi:ferredoxin